LSTGHALYTMDVRTKLWILFVSLTSLKYRVINVASITWIHVKNEELGHKVSVYFARQGAISGFEGVTFGIPDHGLHSRV
jgi:hypothetical protein